MIHMQKWILLAEHALGCELIKEKGEVLYFDSIDLAIEFKELLDNSFRTNDYLCWSCAPFSIENRDGFVTIRNEIGLLVVEHTESSFVTFLA